MRRAAVISAIALTAFCATPVEGYTPVAFKSPTGFINCRGDKSPPAYVDCVELRSHWHRYPASNCVGEARDFMKDEISLEISEGTRRVKLGGCHNDAGPLCTSGDNCATLAYGHHIDIGLIRCASAGNGITCRYTKGRRVGFRIAQENYRIWSE